ncbi:hypothetical protein H2203_001425 [Taxawa tesnikishii (nom. ined.)]|nr:hypothetical protein H2203_001425 [Dothideales sp. JES 119]
MAITEDPGQISRTQTSKPEPAPEPEIAPSVIPHRTLSAPLQFIGPPALRRTRSPYAVEFPQSARLKPLDLGNPFCKHPHGPKRRVTLPSLVVADGEAATLATLVGSPEPRVGTTSLDIAREAPEQEIGLAVTSPLYNPKRRSRSTNDLREMIAATHPQRKRSQEIRYWRESVTGSMLLAFASEKAEEPERQPVEEIDNDPTPVVQQADPFTMPGTSHEAEDVRLIPRRSRQRTPSILVNTLRDQDYRPPPLSAQQAPEDPFYSLPSERSPRPRTPSPPQRTFATLYNIITEERSARRNFEKQLRDERSARINLEYEIRGLRNDVAELQCQLSSHRTFRNSGQRVSSGSGYPTPSRSPEGRYSGFYSGIQERARRRGSDEGLATTWRDTIVQGGRMVSRFSGSDESEEIRMASDDEDEELVTPYELYQTPAEEKKSVGLGIGPKEDGMF